MKTTPEAIDHTAVLEALNWRYATKKFDASSKVPKEISETLMESIRLSPSSMGMQPYRFLKVEDSEVRAELRGVSSNQSQITDASVLIVFAAKATYSRDDIMEFLNVGRELRGYTDEAIEKRAASLERFVNGKSSDEFLNWSARQLYIAMGQLLAAAAMLGVDACPMEGLDAKAYNRILKLDALGLHTYAVVCLGYRAQDDALARQAKIRLPMDTLVKTV